MKYNLLKLFLLGGIIGIGMGCSSDKNDEPEKTYRVGDLYNQGGVKGIVYKLSDAEGRHGVIVSLDDARLAWSTERVDTEAFDENDGAKNQALIEAISGWQTTYPAFAWCAAKNTGGVKGWYLPADNQVRNLYDVWVADKDKFNKSLTDNGGKPIIVTSAENEYYWSSTQSNGSAKAAFAAAFMFLQGVFDYPLKSEVHQVRAVHVF